MLDFNRTVNPACNHRRVVDHGRAREIEDPEIRTQKPHMVSAVMEQVMTIDACGAKTKHRFWVYVPATLKDNLVFLYAIPGESRTWPLLHGSAWRLASGLMVSEASPKCRELAHSGAAATVAVHATLGEVREPLGKAPDMNVYLAGAWREMWTLSLCGRKRDYDLLFLADGAGGGYVTTVDGDPETALADLKEALRNAKRVMATQD